MHQGAGSKRIWKLRNAPSSLRQRNSAQVANCHLSLRDKAIILACAKIGARVIVVKRRTSFGIGELLALRLAPWLH